MTTLNAPAATAVETDILLVDIAETYEEWRQTDDGNTEETLFGLLHEVLWPTSIDSFDPRVVVCAARYLFDAMVRHVDETVHLLNSSTEALRRLIALPKVWEVYTPTPEQRYAVAAYCINCAAENMHELYLKKNKKRPPNLAPDFFPLLAAGFGIRGKELATCSHQMLVADLFGGAFASLYQDDFAFPANSYRDLLGLRPPFVMDPPLERPSLFLPDDLSSGPRQ